MILKTYHFFLHCAQILGKLDQRRGRRTQGSCSFVSFLTRICIGPAGPVTPETYWPGEKSKLQDTLKCHWPSRSLYCVPSAKPGQYWTFSLANFFCHLPVLRVCLEQNRLKKRKLNSLRPCCLTKFTTVFRLLAVWSTEACSRFKGPRWVPGFAVCISWLAGVVVHVTGCRVRDPQLWIQFVLAKRSASAVPEVCREGSAFALDSFSRLTLFLLAVYQFGWVNSKPSISHPCYFGVVSV